MRMIMKFQADDGKEFDTAAEAAKQDHFERVRNIAAKVINERRGGSHENIPTHVVDELTENLIVMAEQIMIHLFADIQDSRRKAEDDAAEFVGEDGQENEGD